MPADVLATRRLVLWLSAAYVLGCAFRSVLPMIDGPRICLDGTVISRIAIGRSVATVAEVSFVAQWVLLLREATRPHGHRLLKQIAGVLLPLAIAAEIASWIAVLTRNNLLHAVENSLWTLGAGLVLLALGALRFEADRSRTHRMLSIAIATTVAYIAFMLSVDIPMYLQRWYSVAGVTVPLLVGAQEIWRVCTPVRVLAAWQEDMPWLTLYFSLAVWVSIALVFTPPLSVASAGKRVAA